MSEEYKPQKIVVIRLEAMMIYNKYLELIGRKEHTK